MTATLDPKTAPERIRAWLTELVPVIDAAIDARLPSAQEDPGRLIEAMRYAVLGPGKRLRPALVIAACEACGGSRQQALPAAAAVEMLHAYTLVHDDLPAMDDDDERRGRATVHIEFGEDIAILAGDGLLTSAFESLAELGANAGAAVAVLARRAGPLELLAGQARDLTQSAAAAPLSLQELEVIHAAKTGALFSAAAELGAIAASDAVDTAAAQTARTREQRQAMARYGMSVGVGFQHADDLDDGEFAEHASAARARRLELSEQAVRIASAFDAGPLVDLAQWIGRS